LIAKRLEGSGLKDTQHALDLASCFIAEETKHTPTPAEKYLTAAADPELDIDEKKEQNEHIGMVLSFYDHKNDSDRGRKGSRGDGGRGRGRGRSSGRGRNGGGDGGASRRPLARQLLAAMML
jgi:uncharacterized membrane protein YgcG